MGPSSSSDANRFLQITIDHILQKAPIMSDHSIPNPVTLGEFRVVQCRRLGVFSKESNRIEWTSINKHESLLGSIDRQ